MVSSQESLRDFVDAVELTALENRVMLQVQYGILKRGAQYTLLKCP